MNVRPPMLNLNRPQFQRHESPLPDQQAAFQQFRGNPSRPFRNEFNNNRGGFNSPRSFNPRNGFNNGSRFAPPDMSVLRPNMGGQPVMNFAIPPPGLPNFSQPPPNLNIVQNDQHQDEPMVKLVK